MSANQQDGEEIFFLFLCSFTFHAKNLLWLDCHSRFFYKLRGLLQCSSPPNASEEKLLLYTAEETKRVDELLRLTRNEAIPVHWNEDHTALIEEKVEKVDKFQIRSYF